MVCQNALESINRLLFSKDMSMPKTLSIIIPVYNEEASIRPFLDRIRPVLVEVGDLVGTNFRSELIFVNDGSHDTTKALLTAVAKRDEDVKLINLSRNFGKEAALFAGLSDSSGDAIIPIDVDLQDPPELIVNLVEHWLSGAKVVNAQRIDRDNESIFKRASAGLFYRFYNSIADLPIPANVGDFRLLDREAVDVVIQLTENSRFNKGLFSWIGFEVATVEYVREKRTAGDTKWSLLKLWSLAVDGIVSSTTRPLRIWSYIGAIIALLAFAYVIFLIVYTLVFGVDTPGYASTIVIVLFLGGLNLLSIGIIGEYVGRIAVEVRGRPLFIVESREGF